MKQEKLSDDMTPEEIAEWIIGDRTLLFDAPNIVRLAKAYLELLKTKNG